MPYFENKSTHSCRLFNSSVTVRSQHAIGVRHTATNVHISANASRPLGSVPLLASLMSSNGSSSGPGVLHDVVEYENLLRSLIPKLNEKDRIRVLEKVVPDTLRTETQLDGRGGNGMEGNSKQISDHPSPNSSPNGGADSDNISSGYGSEGFLGTGSDISFLRLSLAVAHNDS